MSVRIQLLILLACCSLTGCSIVKPSPHDHRTFTQRLPLIGEPAPPEPDEPYPFPAKIAATWTPDTLVQTGRTPTRGFGGRIFFYDEKSRVVPVDGTLVIHGYDDSNGLDPKRSTKRFEFTPEQLTNHFGQTDLGASYSVWIPWDAVGGEQKRISLVASFRTEDGHLVQGVPAIVMLPGPGSKSGQTEIAVERLAPSFKDHQDAVAKATKGQNTMRDIAAANGGVMLRQVAARGQQRVGELAKTPELATKSVADAARRRVMELAPASPANTLTEPKVRTASHRLGNLPQR